MSSPARSRVRNQPIKSSIGSSRRSALKKIARILEDQMTDMGLSEEKKNAKTAELVSFVSDVAASKLVPHSKHSEPLRNAAAQV